MKYNTTYLKDFAKQNPVFTLALAGGTFLAARYVYKRFLKPAPPLPPAPPPVPPPLPPSPSPTPGGGSTPAIPTGGYSYDANQYSDWADTIKSALDGAGTDEKPVLRIMGYMKTRADVLALVEAYGKRSLKSPYQFWDTDPMTLGESLQYDMPEYVDEVNQIIRKTGYRF
jgi:hypothetical protein